MLTFEVKDKMLEEQLVRLLNQQFDGDVERMLSELLKIYNEQLKRLQFSGILTWDRDALTFQKELRGEW